MTSVSEMNLFLKLCDDVREIKEILKSLEYQGDSFLEKLKNLLKEEK